MIHRTPRTAALTVTLLAVTLLAAPAPGQTNEPAAATLDQTAANAAASNTSTANTAASDTSAANAAASDTSTDNATAPNPFAGNTATLDPSAVNPAAADPSATPPGTPGRSSATPAAPSSPTTVSSAATAPAPRSASAPSADPEALARAYRRTGAAPTVEITDQGRGAVSLVPFGHGKPILRCAPLRACAVELEPGELILSTSLGDAERWLVQSAAAGPGARTPLLVVKPTACDLSTNLVVSTDRRIYELALDSPPCHGADLGGTAGGTPAGTAGATAGSGGEGAYNPHLPYTGLIRFYYPDDLVRRWTDQEALAREADISRATGRTPLAPTARLAHLNFDYAWDRSRRWPWVPAQIFDDGEHTYLVLPPAARLAELPILLAVEPGGALALLTYHLEGQTLVADRVLDRAVLLVGHGRPKDEQRLEIANRRTAEAGH